MPPDPPRLGGGIAITDPPPGTVVTAGEPLDVTVEAIGEYEPAKVLVVSSIDAGIAEQGPFVVTLTVALESLGPLTLSAFALDSENSPAQAEDVIIEVQTAASLVGLTVTPDTLYLFH